MKQTFYSNGKLLITGEYAVLDGALALALPTKYGQYLHVEKGAEGTVQWRSLTNEKLEWFEASIPIQEIIDNNPRNHDEIYCQLISIVHYAHLQNPAILLRNEGFKITTELTFPQNWGLGTSSTLINNIAQWFKIDAFELLKQSFGGSGYDIACAQHNSPITYRIDNGIPSVQEIDFKPLFIDKLWFVYLNKKQNSRSAIEAYRSGRNDTGPIVKSVTAITEAIITRPSFSQFRMLLEEHEDSMSRILNLPPIKDSLFADFNGTVKSLGAWGGDFILAASNQDPRDYFASKGFHTVIPYNEMI